MFFSHHTYSVRFQLLETQSDPGRLIQCHTAHPTNRWAVTECRGAQTEISGGKGKVHNSPCKWTRQRSSWKPPSASFDELSSSCLDQSWPISFWASLKRHKVPVDMHLGCYSARKELGEEDGEGVCGVSIEGKRSENNPRESFWWHFSFLSTHAHPFRKFELLVNGKYSTPKPGSLRFRSKTVQPFDNTGSCSVCSVRAHLYRCSYLNAPRPLCYVCIKRWYFHFKMSWWRWEGENAQDFREGRGRTVQREEDGEGITNTKDILKHHRSQLFYSYIKIAHRFM